MEATFASLTYPVPREADLAQCRTEQGTMAATATKPVLNLGSLPADLPRWCHHVSPRDRWIVMASRSFFGFLANQ